MKLKVIVLGAGLVGNVIARDLAENSNIQVTVADINQNVLDKISSNYDIQTIHADLSNQEVINEIVKDYN